MSKSKSKLPVVNGIVVFGGDFLKAGTSRIVVSTDEPMSVLESMRSYYGGNIRGKVVKSNSSTEELFTKELEEKLKSHKTDTINMYKVNSSEVVKVLKEVFDVKTCKKLSFKKDSDSDNDSDNGSDNGSVHEEVKETKSIKKKAVAVPVAVPVAVAVAVVETKSTKKKQVPSVVEAQAQTQTQTQVDVKETKSTSTKKKQVPSIEAVPVEVKDSKSGKKKPEIVDTDHDVKDSKSVKKNLTTKLSSTSKVRIPLSDSEEDDEELLNDD